MGKRLEELKQQLILIEKELEGIKGFRQTQQLRSFQRQLFGEASFIKEKIRKLTLSEEQKKKEWLARVVEANKLRSEKMKRSWRLMRAYQENYLPDLNLKQIRSLYKRYRDGFDDGISGVVWQNPSP